MSEEQTKAVTPEATTPTEAPKVEVEKAKEMTFSQAQLDNIIKSRLDAEKSKHQRQLDEVKKQDDEALKEKAVKEAKSKAELEKLMQQRILEKDTEINKFKNEIKKERIDNSVLSVASQHKAVSPAQVVSLLKDEIKLNDQNRVEILDKNNNIRYNEKGNLLTIEERVREFLDTTQR
jgi:exonuclease VII large subunit